MLFYTMTTTEDAGLINTTRLVDRFLGYVVCDSESGNEKQFCELIERELSALGLSVYRDEAGEKCGSNGWNIRASLPGTGDPILFCAHLDTVSPGRGIRPIVGEDGVIRSAGDTVLGSDDKSGVAAVIEALAAIMDNKLPHRPIEVLFTVCEELGMLGSRHADYSAIASKQAVVLDSSKNGALINRAPANMHIEVTVKGRAAHAGVAPEKGVHALKAAAAAVANIPCGRVDEETVMNVANLLAPGKTNVVPDTAAFQMEIRSFREELLQQRIEQARRALNEACEQFGASYEMTLERHSDPLYVPEDSPLLLCLREAYRELGVEARVEGTFGGSDATWLSANGISAVNIGTGMSAVHGVGEHIAIPDLILTSRVVLAMMQ